MREPSQICAALSRKAKVDVLKDEWGIWLSKGSEGKLSEIEQGLLTWIPEEGSKAQNALPLY